MKPSSMPKASSSTLARTARQLVVHDALEMTKWWAGSNCSSLTPITRVASASPDGAEIITRVAPASRWAAALARPVFLPVDSMTTSMPSSLQGRAFGSDSASRGIRRVPTTIESPSTPTGSGYRPCTESRANSRASASGAPRSLTATISRSCGEARAARRNERPVLPNPLMASRVVIGHPSTGGEDPLIPLPSWCRSGRVTDRAKRPTWAEYGPPRDGVRPTWAEYGPLGTFGSAGTGRMSPQ